MIAGVGLDRIMVSAAMNGVPANWIRDSVEQAGLDPATLPATRTPMPAGIKPWRDIYSAGQSVGLIEQTEPVAALVDRLAAEFAALVPGDAWRGRLEVIGAAWQV
jgi:nitronate monooxygenase